MDLVDNHTGLSPRMNRIDLVAKQRPMDVYFLDDGVETFSVDREDPRVAGVREIYSELKRRLESAAVLAGLHVSDPAVSVLKNQLAQRSAELEDRIARSLHGPTAKEYRDAIFHTIQWIQNANEHELRAMLESSPSPTASSFCNPITQGMDRRNMDEDVLMSTDLARRDLELSIIPTSGLRSI